jgi:hypothetical protein
VPVLFVSYLRLKQFAYSILLWQISSRDELNQEEKQNANLKLGEKTNKMRDTNLQS